jgi:hypothetical protein
MRRASAIVLVLVLLFEGSLMAGIPGHKSEYVGGTTTTIGKEAQGVLNTDDTQTLAFKWKDGEWKVPYDKVTSLSYGQHAGRRVGATVALGVTTLGIGALPVLFSKKRRHYLSIEYLDEQGKAQAAVFQVGKDAIRTTLKSLEVRTGKKVEYEDEEARKAGNK